MVVENPSGNASVSIFFVKGGSSCVFQVESHFHHGNVPKTSAVMRERHIGSNAMLA